MQIFSRSLRCVLWLRRFWTEKQSSDDLCKTKIRENWVTNLHLSGETQYKSSPNRPESYLWRILIDGDQSYPNVKSDWENERYHMYKKTALFFHNYNFSGSKRVVDNIRSTVYSGNNMLDPHQVTWARKV